MPAGDIGVGGREVGYMYGMYKKLVNECTGTFTGKGLDFGGSLIRPEATGFGALYFVQSMLAEKKTTSRARQSLFPASATWLGALPSRLPNSARKW